MDATTLKMAMAGFFHDIGKLADKDALGVTQGYIDDNSQYLRTFNGRPAYRHAVYTAAFIEYLKDDLPDALNQRHWGEGDIFVNLAAGHHNPETPLQWMVTMADWLTSGMDRDVFDETKSAKIAPANYKKTRLLSLFEQLNRSDMDRLDAFTYAYPLRPLSAQAIFPVQDQALDQDAAAAQYRDLFHQFAGQLKHLAHRQTDPALWFEHFESLFMAYTSQMPAARAGLVAPDVSLYDHCRLTAAVAAALYLYHRDTDSLNIAAVKNRQTSKFLLITGNFYGIQNFIFTAHGDTRKYRSKLLRGRSFYVSLLVELAADMLCQALGLPSISIILNAAGQFTVLAPNTANAREALSSVQASVNDWLVAKAHGEVSIGFSHQAATFDDFIGNRFMQLWDRVRHNLDEKKYAKFDLDQYSGVIGNYLDGFDNRLSHPLCPLCGKRPAQSHAAQALPAESLTSVCGICRDQVIIGANLVKSGQIMIVAADIADKPTARSTLEPIFDRYRLVFDDPAGRSIHNDAAILKLWDIALDDDAGQGRATRKFLNGYVPVYDDADFADERLFGTRKSEARQLEMVDEMQPGQPKTLGHIAARALVAKPGGGYGGVDALGILKADVDHLGMLMGCGLPAERFTLSRLATLSRQINYYFALYLPRLLATDARFRDIYTVFAGGDDLFLIGPWHCIYTLTRVLKDSFADYVGHNPDVHFSAGISLQKANTPLDRVAEAAEHALETAKEAGRNRLTWFAETVTWDEVDALEQVRLQFEQWLSRGEITKSMLYRLNELIAMRAAEAVVLQSTDVPVKHLPCLKWRALLHYSAARNIGRQAGSAAAKEALCNQILPLLYKWLETHGGALRIPLWHVLYNHR